MNVILKEKEKLDRLKEKVQLKEKILKEKENKKRFARLNEIGRLAYSANIDHLDKKILLGAFLEIGSRINESHDIDKWIRTAESILEKRDSENTTPLAIKFKKEPTKEVKEKLKELNFKFNRLRNLYEGNGEKKVLLSILKDSDFQLLEIT